MAVIAKQRYKLDIAPSGGWVIVYASQHDNAAREIEFEITNQGNAYSIPASINISVQGIKSNKGYFSHSCSYSGNVVTMALSGDMTDVIGKAICVLKFTNSSQQKLATAKFILNVDSDSSSEGIIIDTEAEEIFNQMLNEIRAQAASISADIAELQSMVGSPLVASTVSAMTDHNKIYVYTGSESGYTNGNWYYWDGSVWTSGGVYNSVAINIDSTPTQGSSNVVSSGGVYSAIKEKGGLSEEAKLALLACFRHVAWIDEDGQDYYDTLETALGETEVSDHLTATLSLGTHEVYTTDSIESLRHYLVVKAHIAGSPSTVITNYTLSGDITTTGTKTITVTYDEMATTFEVSVVENPTGIIYEWDFTKGLIDFRQYKTATLVRFDSEHPAPTIDENGVHFNEHGQRLELLPADANAPMSYFAGKTIQVDVASYSHNSAVEQYHTRFITFYRSGQGEWDSGLVYRKANTTASTLGWSIYAGTNGWGTKISNMERDAISGHTVGFYIDSSLKPKIYLDSTLKSTQNVAFPSGSELKGLSIGTSNWNPSLYDLTMTGLRIYNGEVSS